MQLLKDANRSYSEAACQAQHSIAAFGICSGAKRPGEPSAARKMNAAEHFKEWPRDDYSLEAEREIRKLFAAGAINLR
jgi:hypothetical protein